ncbi:MAG TPA: protease pro-enzyme activation domain-containing protein [Bryobacteraceae bacterium]|nr:protease pro-enzyme activation domain-containing protein [Bryobacteraceae bacterium]
MALQFRPSPAQQQDLDKFLEDLHNPTSPNFRHWLKPEEYAARFGLSASDYSRAAEWLVTHGFGLGPAARGRAWVSFRGTAGQVKAAFGSEVHRYNVNGRTHYSIANDPHVPEALAAVVSSIAGLDDFIGEPDSRSVPKQTSATGAHTLAPDDIAAIYDLNPLYQAGIDGSGRNLVVVGQSQPNLTDVNTFRSKYGLPPINLTPMLVPGATDPGTTGSLSESDLDLQWSGAVARNANIFYVYAPSFYSAVLYAVDQNLAPVITASFSFSCEALNFARLSGFRATAQQANAQGITWLNSAGDAGAAACDGNGSLLAQNGLAVRTPASLPEVTAVGGTEFNEGGGIYWNSTNSTTLGSAKGYVPEMVWNDVAALNSLWVGGGGASIFFPRPAWQTGPGVPEGSTRLVPDVAFSAAEHDPYNAVIGGGNFVSWGTSASAPLFAGMVVLMNQYLDANGLGNINPTLYALAQSSPNAFHDIVDGNNTVPCASGSPDCSKGSFGYAAGPGYDTATGLGSVDLTQLAMAWKGLTKPTQALISVNFSANPVFQHAPDASGASWSFTITLHESAGIAATLNGWSIDGTQEGLALFTSNTIPANGSVTASIGSKNLTVPSTRTFVFSGTDANGNAWSVSFPLDFEGLPPSPAITGVGNAASGGQGFAPGMLISIYGSQLAAGPQLAAVIPLNLFLQDTQVSIGGFTAPIYYVSPSQLNVQIPYEAPVGNARLIVANVQGQSTSTTIPISPSAPGIFTNAGTLIPSSSGKPGDAIILFITGEGKVTPTLADGATPAPTTPIAKLPVPLLPVSMTVGGVPVPANDILFAGIASGLVGVTQVNFIIPPGVPNGPQPVVVTVGSASSAPATITITNGSAPGQ